MTSIKNNTPASAVRQLANPLKSSAPSSPAPAQVTGGWLPKVVKTPARSEAVDKALYAASDAVRSSFDAGVKTTKAVNEATVGKRSDNTESYKYQGVIEVGLEALNRTFEGGGMDLKKGAKFIEQNAKKK